MRYGGLEYELHYSETADSMRDRQTEFLHSHLPVDLVCGLTTCATEFPDQTAAILEALSSFQILSNMWACAVLRKVSEDMTRSPIVFFGARFGVLNSLLVRQMNHAERQVVLIDNDPQACKVAERLIELDDWQKPFKTQTSVVQGDALNFDLCALSDELGADPIVIWTGVEHFEERLVRDYISDNERANALYLLQGTNMPAVDHRNLVQSCGELEQYFEGDPIYSARLKTTLGDRFQIVFAT